MCKAQGIQACLRTCTGGIPHRQKRQRNQTHLVALGKPQMSVLRYQPSTKPSLRNNSLRLPHTQTEHSTTLVHNGGYEGARPRPRSNLNAVLECCAKPRVFISGTFRSTLAKTKVRAQARAGQEATIATVGFSRLGVCFFCWLWRRGRGGVLQCCRRLQFAARMYLARKAQGVWFQCQDYCEPGKLQLNLAW